MDPVQICVTKADLVDVYIRSRLARFAKMFALIMLLLALIDLIRLVVQCGLGAIDAAFVISALLEGMLVSSVVCGALLGLAWLSTNAMARTLEKIGRDTSITWDDEHLHVRSQFGSDSYPWTMFEKWSQSRHVLMLALTRMHIFHFPKRDFSPGELEALRAELVRAGVPAG